MHMHILLYVIMTQLQPVMTAIREYGIYETPPLLKLKINFKFTFHTFITII